MKLIGKARAAARAKARIQHPVHNANRISIRAELTRRTAELTQGYNVPARYLNRGARERGFGIEGNPTFHFGQGWVL